MNTRREMPSRLSTRNKPSQPSKKKQRSQPSKKRRQSRRGKKRQQSQRSKKQPRNQRDRKNKPNQRSNRSKRSPKSELQKPSPPSKRKRRNRHRKKSKPSPKTSRDRPNRQSRKPAATPVASNTRSAPRPNSRGSARCRHYGLARQPPAPSPTIASAPILDAATNSTSVTPHWLADIHVSSTAAIGSDLSSPGRTGGITPMMSTLITSTAAITCAIRTIPERKSQSAWCSSNFQMQRQWAGSNAIGSGRPARSRKSASSQSRVA